MLITLVIYVGTLLLIGLMAWRRGKQTSADFITSSRDHGTWVAALSASAASESGWVTLGLVGTAYTSGISCFWLLPGCLAGYVFNWLVLGPKIHTLTEKSGARDLSDLFAARFGESSANVVRWIRRVVTASVILFLTVYASAQFSATGKTFNAMFGWDYRSGVLLGVALIMTYTAMGGLRAGSWTDVPQATLMFFSLLILPFIIIGSTEYKSGFFSDLEAGNPSALSLTGNTSGWAAIGFVLGWVGIGLGYPGQPHVLRRFMSTVSLGIYRKAAWISLIWSQVVFAGAILVGLAARNRFPGLADPEQALPYAAAHLLPAAVAGLALAGVLSAMWSTANGQIFEAAAASVAGRTKNSQSGPMIVRAAVLCVSLLAGALAFFKAQVIFSVVLDAWGALGAGIGATLAVSLLWRRATAQGALAGLITGPVTLYLWKVVFHLSSTLYELIPAFAVGAGTVWVVSCFTNTNVQSNGKVTAT